MEQQDGWFAEIKAHVAQSVEHVLGKDEVTGSIPVVGSSCRKAVGDRQMVGGKKMVGRRYGPARFHEILVRVINHWF
jgi:hypothetical protein